MHEKYSMEVVSSFLLVLKLDFLRIVCSHEHYVTLNLPFHNTSLTSAPSSPTPSVSSTSSQMSSSSTQTLTDVGLFSDLSREFRSRHFLVGLLLTELEGTCSSGGSGSEAVALQHAVNTVRNLMTSHDFDVRYRDADSRARVAALYLPLLNIVIDCKHQLHDPSIKPRTQVSQQRPSVDELQVSVTVLS